VLSPENLDPERAVQTRPPPRELTIVPELTCSAVKASLGKLNKRNGK
jgi:hypothetical protein